MHIATWVLQIFYGLWFIAVGLLHFSLPEGLPDPMSWMYDLPQGLHYASGAAEILGGLGLILPSVTRIRPQLTPLAAAGLALVMLLGAVWHIPRGEIANVGANAFTGAVMVFIAWVRWRRHPLPPRRPAPEPG